MKVYLCGPMTGRPQFNFPAFDDAATRLRRCGLTVVSPAELDSPKMRAACLASVDGAVIPGSVTWADVLARDIKIVSEDVDGLIFLPGWEKSRGARLEAFVALLTGLTIFGEYQDDSSHPSLWIPAELVRRMLRENMP